MAQQGTEKEDDPSISRASPSVVRGNTKRFPTPRAVSTWPAGATGRANARAARSGRCQEPPRCDAGSRSPAKRPGTDPSAPRERAGIRRRPNRRTDRRRSTTARSRTAPPAHPDRGALVAATLYLADQPQQRGCEPRHGRSAQRGQVALAMHVGGPRHALERLRVRIQPPEKLAQNAQYQEGGRQGQQLHHPRLPDDPAELGAVGLPAGLACPTLLHRCCILPISLRILAPRTGQASGQIRTNPFHTPHKRHPVC